MDEERDVATRARTTILRPAAIYGPTRRARVATEGRLGRRFELYQPHPRRRDLAAIAEPRYSPILMAPIRSRTMSPRAIDITRFCAGLLNIPVPPPQTALPGEIRRANRRVDGRAIRRLGIELAFPSYRLDSGSRSAMKDSNSIDGTG